MEENLFIRELSKIGSQYLFLLELLLKPTYSGLVKKYGRYFLSRDWVGSKWRPVLKVREQLQDKHSETMQNAYR